MAFIHDCQHKYVHIAVFSILTYTKADQFLPTVGACLNSSIFFTLQTPPHDNTDFS